MTRRILLASLASAAAPVRWLAAASRDPFPLGVASGDPTATGVVLWTRLGAEPGSSNIKVAWEVAEDDRFRRVVKKGNTVATPGLAHSVHVEVEGLKPDRWYWYRFRSGAHRSSAGRTRTMPPDDALAARLKFAFASCQHWEAGWFTAYRHMAADAPDLVVHLGDYIYEGAPRDGGVRRHNSPEIVSLTDYRDRHALYKTDPDLRRMHESAPWIVTWDDHEVDNNYAADVPEDKQTRESFLERRANAYQAYYEHMPLRSTSIPVGTRMQLYRRLRFGRLADFWVLDTRQYRSDQPCGDGTKPPCEGAFSQATSILGDRQEQWLTGGLAGNTGRWNVLAQQVMVARVDRMPGEGERYSMDQWTGYEASRMRLLRFLGERKPSNPVVITGDIHTNWCNDLALDARDPKSPVVASEFVGTSISSGGDGSDTRPETEGLLRENPHLRFFNNNRGYVLCEATPDRWRTDYRIVRQVAKPDAAIETRASFVLENGRLGARRA
jgi:alkaline phosphatase D